MKEFIITAISTAWNCFFEDIWKKRCEIFIIWEKEVGIDKKTKREKRNIEGKPTEENSKASCKEKFIRVEKSQTIEEKKKVKEVEKKEIDEAWFGSVTNFIYSKTRPFTYGLTG